MAKPRFQRSTATAARSCGAATSTPAIAVTVMFVCSIFSPWAVVFGVAPLAIAHAPGFWAKSPQPKSEPVIS